MIIVANRDSSARLTKGFQMLKKTWVATLLVAAICFAPVIAQADNMVVSTHHRHSHSLMIHHQMIMHHTKHMHHPDKPM